MATKKLKKEHIEQAKESMDIRSLAPTLEEMERIARELVAYMGMGDEVTQPVVFTVQTRGRKNSLGHFASKRWATREGEDVHEINVSAETFHSNPIDISHTIAHEMVHLANAGNEIKDTASNGQRHNKKFKETAEGYGLVCPDKADRKYGYGITTLGAELRTHIEKDILPDVGKFMLARQIVEARGKGKTKTFKYVCGCDQSFRSGKLDLDVTCNICKERFVVEA